MKSTRTRSLLVCSVLAAVIVVASPLSSSANINSARRDITRLRFDRAENKLVDVAKASRGDKKQEALFLLAGLKNSTSEAEIIYQEVVQIDPSNEWAERSQLELAKIQYAVGNYGEALGILDASSACRHSEEACYFQGLSAAMLKRYPEARATLSRVHSGKFRPWAYLSLAEIEMETNDPDEACRKYRSMSRASLSPTAMYRYGECLEKQGRSRGARDVFEEILDVFADTPEALLAREKLEMMSPTKSVLTPIVPDEGDDTPISGGFTLQFGAFHDRTNAIKLAAYIKRQLPGVRIDSDLVNNKEVHRVRYGQFRTRQEAQREADKISQKIGEPYTIMMLP